ncbi:phosphotransferase family protein [Vibrio campbellii]|uniref:phosphotransferase family protein n=1 Tax=Vibrio campbellii TaxID=680 RepID=UPI00249BC110|nr:hypothetical protein [Vibrio campbellii]
MELLAQHICDCYPSFGRVKLNGMTSGRFELYDFYYNEVKYVVKLVPYTSCNLFRYQWLCGNFVEGGLLSVIHTDNWAPFVKDDNKHLVVIYPYIPGLSLREDGFEIFDYVKIIVPALFSLSKSINCHDISNFPRFPIRKQIDECWLVFSQLPFVTNITKSKLKRFLSDIDHVLENQPYEGGLCDAGFHNIIIDGETVRFIDFDDAAMTPKGYDVACYLAGLAEESLERNINPSPYLELLLSNQTIVQRNAILQLACLRVIWHICYYEGEKHYIDAPLLSRKMEILEFLQEYTHGK